MTRGRREREDGGGRRERGRVVMAGEGERERGREGERERREGERDVIEIVSGERERWRSIRRAEGGMMWRFIRGRRGMPVKVHMC